jgi:hypothetical protein
VNPTEITHPAFDTAWNSEVAANSGVPIGADYRHWMLKGWHLGLAFQALTTYAASESGTSEGGAGQATHASSEPEPRGVGAGEVLVAHLNVWKTEPGFYAYSVRVDGRDDELLGYDGLKSIRQALEVASHELDAPKAPITALQVSYRGITGGTFTPARLARDAESIAQHLVDTYAGVMG